MGLLFLRFDFIKRCPNLPGRMEQLPDHDRPFSFRIDSAVGVGCKITKFLHLYSGKVEVAS